MTWEAILRKLLPPRWPRWIALAALPVIVGAYNLPSALPEAYLPSAPTEVFLIRLVLALAAAVVAISLVLMATLIATGKAKKAEECSAPSEMQNGFTASDDNMTKVLVLVARYHAQEIPATAKRIAADVGQDPRITLAFMEKYHDDQFITFRNGGKPPDLDTPFFLSAKALQVIKIAGA